ncbi:unnamed protein product [Zymoseptoria tritici ST99CH_1A5]|uniref:Uncharacterized protein n=1 Tax=Zymoseptoria tritici ST99CH_1A5 TaxID=1276529 RepID=A0A1Y6LXN7_ZYMTR|nr:unnamed protein product [Zymoseptoria tritici ST99CH_1A5]
MSLAEAYSLAHTAQTRLNHEAGRPDRHLRYVVGHLMHYESLRLRIVDIENDLATRRRSPQFHRFQHRPSSLSKLASAPLPPTAGQLDEDDTDEDDGDNDDYDDALFLDGEDADDDLSLSRFPSRAGLASPPTSPTEPQFHHELHDPEPDLSYSPSASSDEYDEDDDTEDDSDFDDACLIAYPSHSHTRPQSRIRTPSDDGLYEGMAELGLGKNLPGVGRRGSSTRGSARVLGHIEQLQRGQTNGSKSSDGVGVHVEEIEVAAA